MKKDCYLSRMLFKKLNDNPERPNRIIKTTETKENKIVVGEFHIFNHFPREKNNTSGRQRCSESSLHGLFASITK